MELREYQKTAKKKIFEEWNQGHKKTLLVQATGTGKTIVFANVIKEILEQNPFARVLILAHRDELLRQAQDKLRVAAGIDAGIEKAQETTIGTDIPVVIGSVQSMSGKRLDDFPVNYFTHIIIDEAHHATSQTYTTVLAHFPDAYVLGVTATPNRADQKSLARVFDSTAFEYNLRDAIKDGYLSPIKAQCIPLQLDISQVAVNAGDYAPGELANTLDPYLEQIATKMETYCKDRKTIVFTPLVKTSQRFAEILNDHGFMAAEVNGQSSDRKDILNGFADGTYNVCVNSALLCLDEQTEILTDKGFLKYDEITYDSKIANWNFDNTVFFDYPKNIIHRPLNSDEYMISVESRTINFRVTNKHNMIIYNRGTKEYNKKAANEINQYNILPTFGYAEPINVLPVQENHDYKKSTLNSCVYNLVHRENYSREEAKVEALRRLERKKNLRYKNPNELTLAECKFIGFWIADGSINHLKKSGIEYTASQMLRYKNIINWFDKVIEECGFDVRKTFHDKKIQKSGKITNEHYIWHFSRGTGGGSQERNGLYSIEPYLDKNGNELFWGLNEAQFDAVLEGYWLGDGCHGEYNDGFPTHIHMNDTRKSWIELLCALGSIHGWKCAMHLIAPYNPEYKIQYGLTMIKHGKQHLSSKTIINKEPYSPENVWCVTTTSGNIITRRKGIVTVMGNCEGYDEPSVDCIVCLRPTQSESLYQQIVGRGTRLCNGKNDLLLLDFLWLTGRHKLCKPADLIASDEEIAKKMCGLIDDSKDPIDILNLEEDVITEINRDKEAALARQLEVLKKQKEKYISSLQFFASLGQLDELMAEPIYPWEREKPTTKQLLAIEKFGLDSSKVGTRGLASKIMEICIHRSEEGLCTVKQIKALEKYGFMHVGKWTFEEASAMLDKLAKNSWKVPFNIKVSTYKPTRLREKENA